jgi:hypothetical protein
MFLLSPISKSNVRRSKIESFNNGLDSMGDTKYNGGSTGNSHGSLSKRGARGEQTTTDMLQMS